MYKLKVPRNFVTKCLVDYANLTDNQEMTTGRK